MRGLVLFSSLLLLCVSCAPAAYRDVVLDGQFPGWPGLLYFSLFALALWLVGMLLFARVKHHFADLV